MNDQARPDPKLYIPLVLCLQSPNTSFDHVFYINKITLLLAMLENAEGARRTSSFALDNLINHARRNTFVCFARTINVEVAQPDDNPIAGIHGNHELDKVIHD